MSDGASTAERRDERDRTFSAPRVTEATTAPPEVLATAVVGSYSVPDWLGRFRTEFHRGRLSARALREIEEVAIKAAVVDQVLAGLDVISDGELRRDNDMDYLLAVVDGVDTAGEAKRDYFDYLHASVPRPLDEQPTVDTDELLREFRFVRSLTDRAVSVSLPGPFSLSKQVHSDVYDEAELVLALARAVNVACRALANAGATNLQLDEPRLAGYPEAAALALEAVGVATEGVGARIALHVCYGNRFARPAWEGHYDFLFPAILESGIDKLVLEFARKGPDDLQLFERFPPRFRVGVGVVDVKSLEVERVEVIENRLHKALEVLQPDQIVVNPDCGLRHLPIAVARAKLVAMCTAARRVRADVLGERS